MSGRITKHSLIFIVFGLVTYSFVYLTYYNNYYHQKDHSINLFRLLFDYPNSSEKGNWNLTTDQSIDGIPDSIPVKKILLWNSPHRIEVAAFGTGHQPFVDHGCPVTNCYIQANNSEFWSQAIANDSEILKSFDAVLVNVHELRLSFLPEYERPSGQRFVWLSQESPSNTLGGIVDRNPGKFHSIFNWTMTYKRDADIQLLYGRIQLLANNTGNADHLRQIRAASLANKTGTTVAWMVSHCKTTSRRENYVQELQKYIPVDIYGHCGNLSCPRNDEDWISTPECYEMIDNKYKFYLSFENSFCIDYGTVTEKFFSILQLDVVPIVFGAADYQSIAPNHSYINALDFSSPAELVEYLHLLDENDELYLDYLEWKSHYRVESGAEQMARYAFCDLCAKLNRCDEPEKVYDSMMYDWSVSTQCRPGWKSSNLSPHDP